MTSSAPTASTRTTPAAQPPTRRIVDAPVRVFHALFALCFLGAYLTSEGESLRLLHVTLGYTLAGLLAFRVVYGLFGPRQARLSLLWRKLSGLPQWLAQATSAIAEGSVGGVNWRQGQNLILAFLIMALLVLAVPLTLSGYASYNEWGDGLGDVHETVGNLFLLVVLAHIAVIAALSIWRRKNLAMQMVHGRTEGAGPDLAARNHLWLAALLLVAVLAYWRWEWQQSPHGLLSAQAVADLVQGRGGEENDDD